jgi:hypothetical protein
VEEEAVEDSKLSNSFSFVSSLGAAHNIALLHPSNIGFSIGETNINNLAFSKGDELRGVKG